MCHPALLPPSCSVVRLTNAVLSERILLLVQLPAKQADGVEHSGAEGRAAAISDAVHTLTLARSPCRLQRLRESTSFLPEVACCRAVCGTLPPASLCPNRLSPAVVFEGVSRNQTDGFGTDENQNLKKDSRRYPAELQEGEGSQAGGRLLKGRETGLRGSQGFLKASP